MLKRGERVKLISPRYTWIKLSPGAVGTVLRDVDAGDTVGVSFDDWQGGHNAEGVLKDNSGWFLNLEDVEVHSVIQTASNQAEPAETTEAAKGRVRDVQAPARSSGAYQGGKGTGVPSGVRRG